MKLNIRTQNKYEKVCINYNKKNGSSRSGKGLDLYPIVIVVLILLSLFYFFPENSSKNKITGLITYPLQGSQGNISASDVCIWQGQYYTGTTFNTGTYEFEFTVYDSQTGGNICYSNTTTLTTGNWGEWITEQVGVNYACNNSSKSYYLNININGADQTPRRRLVVWDFLRKDIDEVTTGSLVLHGILQGLSPLKLQDEINFIKPDGTITSALYNAPRDAESELPSVFSDSLIHDIIQETNIYGMQECFWDENTETMQMCISGAYLPYRATTISRSLQIVGTPANKPVNENFTLCEGNKYADCDPETTGADLLVEDDIEAIGSIFSQENITADDTVFSSFLGSLASRITKLWVQNIDATGNMETSENVSAKYFKGDGSLLTGLPAGSGLAPVYLESDLNATNAGYTTIFTISLVPSKMNIIKIFLAQSSSNDGTAIQNRAIFDESGPIGHCHFETQEQSGAQIINNILVGTDSDNIGMTKMNLDINIPVINTITCTIIADTNQRNLIIQFQSENTYVVTTNAGSYYINAVNE